MVLRHHNEAESLNAVQKMDWEFAVTSLEDNRSNTIDYQFIPMVRVSDDFGLDRWCQVWRIKTADDVILVEPYPRTSLVNKKSLQKNIPLNQV